MTQTIAQPEIPPEAKEKTAQFVWTAIIVSFFVIQAIIWAVAISLTTGNSSQAIVAGYDEKALSWDQTQAAKRFSEQLGWSFDLQIKDDADIRKTRTVEFTLLDRNDDPIEDASINLDAFHTGRATEVQQLVFQHAGSGVYVGSLRVKHSGHWQFDGAAKRGEDTFLISKRQKLEIK